MSGITVERGTQGEDDGAVLLRLGDAVELLTPLESCVLAKDLLDAAGFDSHGDDLTDESFDDLLALINAGRAGDRAGVELIVRSARWRGLVFAAAMVTGAAVEMGTAARLASFGALTDPDEWREEIGATLRKTFAVARGRAAGLGG